MGDPTVHEQMRVIWGDYNERQKFEHELIDRKTTWMLVAQGLFFAAYGTTFGQTEADLFRLVVAGSGLATAGFVLVGVLALIRSKRMSWRAYEQWFERDERRRDLPGPIAEESLQWGVRTGNTEIALSPDVLLSVIFVVAWGVLLSAPSG